MCGTAAITIYVYSYIRILESRVTSFQVQHTWYLDHGRGGTRYTQNRRQNQRYGGLFCRKNSLCAGSTYIQVLRTEQFLHHETEEEEEKRSFPMERGSIARHHPPWNSQCTPKSRRRLCPKPNVTPRFSLGDVREVRWLPSHRWTETTPIWRKSRCSTR